MGSSVQEKKMHYPAITEKHLAERWQVSLTTLQRWRLDNEGPFGQLFTLPGEQRTSTSK